MDQITSAFIMVVIATMGIAQVSSLSTAKYRQVKIYTRI